MKMGKVKEKRVDAAEQKKYIFYIKNYISTISKFPNTFP
jgi:hypothetical protein